MIPSAPTVVVAQLPPEKLSGAERVASQSLHARRAVKLSADLRGARLGELCKDEDDVPTPSNGWFWSLSHCGSWVAGVVHDQPIGVDVEDRRDIRSDVIERVLPQPELRLFGRLDNTQFLRGWTAKEAVLKEFGVGLAGLARCRIVAVHDVSVEVHFDQHVRHVCQIVAEHRVISVSLRGDALPEFLVLDHPLLASPEVRP